MKKIHLLPPPSEKQIYIVQTKMAIHDIVSLAYYLENFDRCGHCINDLNFFCDIRSRIDPDALVIQDCGLNDETLSVLGKRVIFYRKGVIIVTLCVIRARAACIITPAR